MASITGAVSSADTRQRVMLELIERALATERGIQNNPLQAWSKTSDQRSLRRHRA